MQEKGEAVIDPYNDNWSCLLNKVSIQINLKISRFSKNWNGRIFPWNLFPANFATNLSHGGKIENDYDESVEYNVFDGSSSRQIRKTQLKKIRSTFPQVISCHSYDLFTPCTFLKFWALFCQDLPDQDKCEYIPKQTEKLGGELKRLQEVVGLAYFLLSVSSKFGSISCNKISRGMCGSFGTQSRKRNKWSS